MKALLIIIAAGMVCAGYLNSHGPEEAYIQGTWRAAGEVPGEDGPGAGWLMEWSFDDGRFVQSGYPPLRQTGRYRVVQAKDGRISLDLYDQEGTFGEQGRTVVIVIDRAADTISIDGLTGFVRVTPAE